MPSHSRSRSDAPPPDLALLLPAALLVLSATLVRGGNRYAALMVIEWLALAVLVVIGLQALLGARTAATGSGWQRAGLWALALSPLLIGLVQLVPLPADTWLGLPGRDSFAAVVSLDPAGTRPLSLTPDNTALSLLAALPVLAALLLPLSASDTTTRLILRVWIGVAAFQAALGLLQIGGFPALYLDERITSGVIGSFANRNHFANFLMLLLPVVLLEALGPESRRSRPQRGARQWPWIVLLFVLIVALLSSLSRAAIAIGLLTLLASALLLPQRQRLRNGVLPALVATAGLVALALVAGGLDWLERFDASVLGADASFRQLNRNLTWDAAIDFWPLGSGLGSFGTVFPSYQADTFSYYFVEHAHSDFLQWLLETGLPGLLALALALALVVARGAALVRARREQGSWREADRLAVAAGLGVLALALHAWVDFPLHIPANAMLGAFLLGCWLRRSDQGPQTGPYN